jgi:uncharacterized protein
VTEERPAGGSDSSRAREVLDLMDWKRTVFATYADVRAADDPEAAWRRWRAVRDRLFAEHPQSPIPADERSTFEGVPYFDYDPAARVAGELSETPSERYDIATSGKQDGSYSFTRFATVRFDYRGHALELEVYWLDGYGGGIFLPFRDGTSGTTTYGAGRYLLDTVKGADLGTDEQGRLVLDFNFAYNPSCSYDPSWVCPLAPPPNRLGVPIEAGERYQPVANA